MGKKLLIVILFLGALIYGRTLFYPFVDWDDAEYISKNPHMSSSWSRVLSPHDAWVGKQKEYLPVLETVNRVLYTSFGPNPFVFHAAAVFFHLLASFLFFQFVLRLGFSKRVAFFSVLLFVIHPLHVETAAWVSGLKDSLSSCFLLGALLLFLRERIFISSILLTLALMSKGTSIVFVPYALISLWWVHKKLEKNDFFQLLPAILISCLFVLITFKVASANAVIKSDDNPTTWMTMVYVVVLYIRNIFVPYNLSAHYKPIPIETFSAPHFLMAVIILVGLIAAAILLKKKSPALLFALLWLGAGLLPVLNIVPISLQMADRYMYLSMAGFLILISILLEKIRNKKIQIACLAIILVGYGSASYARTSVWKSSLALWKDAAFKAPHDTIAWNNYGTALVDENELESAFQVYDRLVQIAPWKPAAWNNRGNVKLKIYKRDRTAALLLSAELDLKKAIEIKPDYAIAYNNLGLVRWERGLLEKNVKILKLAQDAFRTALIKDPTYEPAKNNQIALAEQLKSLERKKSNDSGHRTRK